MALTTAGIEVGLGDSNWASHNKRFGKLLAAGGELTDARY